VPKDCFGVLESTLCGTVYDHDECTAQHDDGHAPVSPIPVNLPPSRTRTSPSQNHKGGLNGDIWVVTCDMKGKVVVT